MGKILIIEDDSYIRMNLVDILESEGHDVFTAEDGQVGIRQAKEHLPELILCDVLMPNLDGYGVLKEIRQNPLTAGTPFLFLTAKAAREDFRHGMDLGADDYLVKPFEINSLIRTVRARLEKRAREVEQIKKLRENLSRTLPHELRTPLTSIIGMADFLRTPELVSSMAQVHEMAQNIHDSAMRLHKLIENYLLYAELVVSIERPEDAKLWKGSSTYINEGILRSFALKQAQMYNREADLNLRVTPCNAQISETAWIKIVEELTNNACKFSPKGTPVQITVDSDDKTVVITVTDQGIGMTNEEIANIGAYMQFERVEREQQGSGLGLSIVKLLTQLSDGKCVITSEPDNGTSVQVILQAGSSS
ncbi:MAG: hybrid sensor histidine kinase/response regulator [Gemmatimonadetes bacterium]|nr:MAG: hybrid sensor histidine kinase/response regulator [Gemmatimonadota bacterium]